MNSLKSSFLIFMVVTFFSSLAFSYEPFFIMGSGDLNLKNLKTGKTVKVRYRMGENEYLPDALKKINEVYGSSYEEPTQRMSLRFIELLSYLQNHFTKAQIQVLSGYRSPTLNHSLREQGKLAATSSMHMEAAAADIKLAGVEISQVKDFMMSLNCCGVGYYHGKHIHLDVGPKRWWDEKTSGTEKKEAQENEKIILMTERDVYRSKDTISLDLARISDYPIFLPTEIILEKSEGEAWKKLRELPLEFPVSKPQKECQAIQEKIQSKGLKLPPLKSVSPGIYRLTLKFCEKNWKKMPSEISSNSFEIRLE